MKVTEGQDGEKKSKLPICLLFQHHGQRYWFITAQLSHWYFQAMVGTIDFNSQNKNQWIRQIILKYSAEQPLCLCPLSLKGCQVRKPRGCILVISAKKQGWMKSSTRDVGESQRFFFFLFPFSFQQHSRSISVPSENQSSVATGHPPQWQAQNEKTLQSMTHRVRCHTSTGCLIAALRTMSTWVKWAESLSTVRWVEETVLLLIWLGGWILKSKGQSGSSWVNMPAQFYSWGAFLAVDAGGHRGASFEWHSKPQNVAECGHWSKCIFFPPSHFVPHPLLLLPRLLFSHQSNMTWHNNSIVMSHCDRFIDEK